MIRRRSTGVLLVLAVIVAVAVSLLSAPPASAGPEDLEELRREVAELQKEIDGEEKRLAALQADIDALVEEVEKTEARRNRIIAELSARVGAAYRYGVADVSTAVMLMVGQDPVEMADSMAKLDVVNEGDVTAEEEAARITEELKAQQVELDAAKEEQETALESLLLKKQDLSTQLRVQEALYGAPVAGSEWSLGGAAGPVPAGSPTFNGSMACPVSTPYQFIDSYGAPRSGGRSHAGVDIFAPHGSPLYAVESGVIERARDKGGIGGLYIWMVGDSGNEYYYAHNSANLVSAGQRVSAGQVIGRLGNTGNAAGHPSHLHWEVHPGGGGAVNPYPMARQLCP